MIGSDYLIDHVIAEHNKRNEERLFRGYVGDLLMIIVEGKTATVNYRYADLIERPKQEKQKTADEIAIEVITRAGLKGKANGINGAGSEAIA